MVSSGYPQTTPLASDRDLPAGYGGTRGWPGPHDNRYNVQATATIPIRGRDPLEHAANISAIAEVIQLAVAPVFLLTGIAGILSVLAARLGRVIDRARLVDRLIARIEAGEHRDVLFAEGDVLWRRIRLINWAIRLAVSSALLICLVVMSLFVGDLALINMGTLIAGLFIGAMILIIAALLLLLLEVSKSTRKMMEGVELMMSEAEHAK